MLTQRKTPEQNKMSKKMQAKPLRLDVNLTALGLC